MTVELSVEVFRGGVLEVTGGFLSLEDVEESMSDRSMSRRTAKRPM